MTITFDPYFSTVFSEIRDSAPAAGPDDGRALRTAETPAVSTVHHPFGFAYDPGAPVERRYEDGCWG